MTSFEYQSSLGSDSKTTGLQQKACATKWNHGLLKTRPFIVKGEFGKGVALGKVQDGM